MEGRVYAEREGVFGRGGEGDVGKRMWLHGCMEYGDIDILRNRERGVGRFAEGEMDMDIEMERGFEGDARDALQGANLSSCHPAAMWNTKHDYTLLIP